MMSGYGAQLCDPRGKVEYFSAPVSANFPKVNNRWVGSENRYLWAICLPPRFK